MSLRNVRPDNFTVALLATVLPASLLPCHGETAHVFGGITDAAIALLFFLHGAKLPGSAIMPALIHWRLHLTVFASTFVLFPLLGPALILRSTRRPRRAGVAADDLSSVAIDGVRGGGAQVCDAWRASPDRGRMRGRSGHDGGGVVGNDRRLHDWTSRLKPLLRQGAWTSGQEAVRASGRSGGCR